MTACSICVRQKVPFDCDGRAQPLAALSKSDECSPTSTPIELAAWGSCVGIQRKLMRPRPFQTIIVATSPLLREGVARILGAEGFRIIASAPNFDDVALDSIQNQQSILLIADTTNDPGAVAGKIALFKNQHPTARIAVLASHCNLSDIVAAFRSGANAYFINVVDKCAFIKSLDLVMLGQTIVPPELLYFFMNHEDKEEDNTKEPDVETDPYAKSACGSKLVPSLSEQEINILRCLLEGDANKVIARKIDIAEATVKGHLKTILRKIRAENRTQAALWAMHNLSFIGSPGTMAEARWASSPKASTFCVAVSAETRTESTCAEAVGEGVDAAGTGSRRTHTTQQVSSIAVTERPQLQIGPRNLRLGRAVRG